MSGPPRLGSTVDRFSFPVTRRRYGTSDTNPDGFVVAGASADTTIRAHCFPAPGETLARLPELQITGRTIEVHTTADLRLANIATGERGDVVVYDGTEFECQTRAEWTGGPAGAQDYRAVVATEVIRP